MPFDVNGPTRQDTWAVSVFVEDQNGNLLNCEIWDAKDGGEVDSEETKYPPGGMAPKVSLGGQQTTGNVTVSRLYRLVRDHQKLMSTFFAGAGKAKMKIVQHPLDLNGNPFGTAIVYNGILKRVTPPTVDSKSSDEARIELEMTPDGLPMVQASA